MATATRCSGGVQHKFGDSFSGFFRGYGYTANSDYDQGGYGYVGGNDEVQNYNQSWDTGLRYNSGIYSSQLIANYQHLKSYNYSNDLGRYAGDATLDDMEQRYIQWGIVLRLGMVQLAVALTGNRKNYSQAARRCRIATNATLPGFI